MFIYCIVVIYINIFYDIIYDIYTQVFDNSGDVSRKSLLFFIDQSPLFSPHSFAPPPDPHTPRPPTNTSNFN